MLLRVHQIHLLQGLGTGSEHHLVTVVKIGGWGGGVVLQWTTVRVFKVLTLPLPFSLPLPFLFLNVQISKTLGIRACAARRCVELLGKRSGGGGTIS